VSDVEGNSAARWVRASLQVNPYSYIGGKRPSDEFESEGSYNAAVIEACLRADIEAIAVTDHWSIDDSLSLLAAAEAAGIHALPGFEATTSEGVHVLVIFPSGTSASTINAAMGACGGYPKLRGSGRVALLDLIAHFRGEDVLVVPAHANVDSGLFGKLVGQQLERAVTDPALHAIGISPDLPPASRQTEILNGRSPFAREHRLAFIHADDISHPDTFATAGGSTWFKLSEVSLANLAMAMKAPETRVRVSDPQARSGARLRQVRFEGGFLDGVTIPLSDELTTIIGGRGTGKSTVIESIRFALEVPVRGVLAKREYERMVSQVLGVGANVTVLVDVLAPAANTYTIRRSEGETARVMDASGKILAMKPLDLIDDVEIFGQHELAELAHDPVEVARMLARFAGQGGPDTRLLQTERLLGDNRDRLRRAEDELAELDKQLADLPRLTAQKQRYEETGAAERLRVIDNLNSDEQRFVDAKSLVEDVRIALRSIAAETLVERMGRHEPVANDRPALPTHRAAEDALNAFRGAFDTGISQLLEAANNAERVINEQVELWRISTSDLREENQAVLRDLHEEGLEPKKYLEASSAVSALDQRANQRMSKQQAVEALRIDRVKLVEDLHMHRDRLRTTFIESVRRATEAAGGDVVVQAARNLNRQPLLDVLDSHIEGQRSHIRNAFEADTFTAAEFVHAVRTSPTRIADIFGLSSTQARKVIDAGEPFLRELEEITLPDAVLVKLNVGREDEQREYRALDDLSRGQKATALLLLLLSAATTPLIIDQPEDDLDNRFIYRGIVRRLRALKGKRQLIMTTHNANIPVLGDAELLIALESDRGHGRPIEDGVGSIDSEGVRRVAEEILEGGHEAFNQRRYRYGY
jgi:DNA repair ATPase RecN